MLGNLIPKALRRASPDTPKPPHAPRPFFAVGDVHGMADLLDTMIERIAARIRAERLEDAVVVFLGDYVDRGPQSSEAIDLLIRAPARLGVETRFVRGNHEDFVLRFLRKPTRPTRWLDWGGIETIESYGIDPHDFDPSAEGRTSLATALADAMGAEHLDFLRTHLVTHYDAWPYFFCHAGVDPGRSPAEQEKQTLVHGTKSFRKGGAWPDSLVIHGHYISGKPEFGTNRLGVDTGAYRTGTLTAAYCRGDTIEFIEAHERGFQLP